MEEKQSITPKELASAFEMKVIDFAKMVGYSKQGIYQMLDRTNGINTPRFYSMIKLMEFESAKKKQEDIRAAENKEENRKYAIKCLREYFGIQDSDN